MLLNCISKHNTHSRINEEFFKPQKYKKTSAMWKAMCRSGTAREAHNLNQGRQI
jgi:hypothetical protein